MRGDKNITKFESLEALAKGHLDLAKRFGIDPSRRLDLPEDMANAEAMAEVYTRLGRPETPEGYDIQLPEGADDSLKAIGGKIAAVAHGAGLSPAQLKPFVDMLNEETAATVKAEQDAFEAQAKETETTLKTEWGARFEPYKAEIGKLIQELAATTDDPQAEAAIAELNASGYGNSLPLMRMLAKMADLRAEPGAIQGDGGASIQARGMTPASAEAELATMEADKDTREALLNGNHPRHKQVFERRQQLLAYKRGDDPLKK